MADLHRLPLWKAMGSQLALAVLAQLVLIPVYLVLARLVELTGVAQQLQLQQTLGSDAGANSSADGFAADVYRTLVRSEGLMVGSLALLEVSLDVSMILVSAPLFVLLAAAVKRFLLEDYSSKGTEDGAPFRSPSFSDVFMQQLQTSFLWKTMQVILLDPYVGTQAVWRLFGARIGEDTVIHASCTVADGHFELVRLETAYAWAPRATWRLWARRQLSPTRTTRSRKPTWTMPRRRRTGTAPPPRWRRCPR